MPRLLLSVLLLAALLGGCDASVVPLVDADRNYSMYGVFNPRADSQAVIVYPIEGSLQPLPNEPLDATVTSTDLGTSETRVWSDSVMVRDGSAVHVFWSPFRAQYGTTYRLDVTGTRGRSSGVTVRIPPLAALDPGPVNLRGVIRQDVRITSQVERLNNVTVIYLIRAKMPPGGIYPIEFVERPCLRAPCPPPRPPEPVPTDTLVEQTATAHIDYQSLTEVVGSDWVVPINLTQDFVEILRRIRARGPYDQTYGVQLLSVTVSVVAANAAWDPPDGQFFREILVQPGTMSNVERGFGFVGAGYDILQSWTYPDETLYAIGFRPPTDE